MMPHEISQFEQVRVQARAYLCLLLNRSVPNNMPSPDFNVIVDGLKLLKKERIKIEAMYVLDGKGQQISQNISDNPDIRTTKLGNHTSRAYYHRAVRERKCVITNPYPSSLTNDLSVTASYPVYDDQKHLHYVVCVDIALRDLLTFAQPTTMDSIFGYVSKISYTIFSASLLLVAFMLFFHGIQSIAMHGFEINEAAIKHMFEATILLTLALAIFDLVKTIFEEEVLGRHDEKSRDIHRTMIKFLGSIIIALSIEALMLVFKFALIDPEKIIHAVYILGGVALLLIGLSIYLKATEHRNDKC
ncbi:MAG: PDC sensor domain-containing protein [Epsilonproteobacteria bacterium]|nr:PDC sensor domain-containing protein [Campylobacterota bacterium]